MTALVVGRPGSTPQPEALRAHCAARLAPYKVPKRIELVAEPLPRTRSGKLLRRELQSAAASTATSAGSEEHDR